MKYKLLILVLMLLPTITGCGNPAEKNSCLHQWSELHSAVTASFFTEGNIAYSQCSDCGELRDAQQIIVDSIVTPKLSTDLAIYINDEQIPLDLASLETERITWTLNSITVKKGDIIKIGNTNHIGSPIPYVGEGNLDENCSVLRFAAKASVALVATPDQIVLTLSDDQSKEATLFINGDQYPMRHINTEPDTYLYDYAELNVGDKVTIADRDILDLTQITGEPDCFEQREGCIQITKKGVYHIQYTPSQDQLFIEELSQSALTDAAFVLDQKIVSLPSYLELYYADDIKTLYEEYKSLSRHIWRPLRTAPKLEAMYDRLLAMEADASPVIYYMNTQSTNHVYCSRADLFRAFLTDFYYYIVLYHGTARLETFHVHNLNDFINLATNPDSVGQSDLYGFGYASGIYLLESRNNTTLAQQSENSFFGFCHRNGLYREILPFLINTFSFWRIDEGYANPTNHGADIFAEPWASAVDISKFFYHNEITSYVKSERILDYICNTAGVIQGFDHTDPLPNIKLRGYVFEGWYDNPTFHGDPVTDLTESGEKVNLYAKWSIDEQQRDQDDANTVNNYIYNLTTIKAVKNAETVGYVKTMYEALTDQAKALVTEVETLQRFMDAFS